MVALATYAAIVFGTVILYGALGEILTEKSGNLNLGVPGIMYLGGIAGLASSFFYELSTPNPNPAICLILSFVCAFLSAAAANISASASSVAKGETLLDTGRTLDHMGTDVIIIRHPMSGAPHLLAKHVRSAVINAGDGMNEHPTQALLDMFTMREKKGEIKGLKVAIIGDVMHSRVARSNIWGLNTMGAEVVLAGPPTLMPYDLEAMGVKATTDVDEALRGADVVMGLRIQRERQQSGLFPSVSEYSEFFGISSKRMELPARDAIVMHPGPVNRGVELNSDVIDADYSFIDEQVTNGVAVRMALLYMMTRRA